MRELSPLRICWKWGCDGCIGYASWLPPMHVVKKSVNSWSSHSEQFSHDIHWWKTFNFVADSLHSCIYRILYTKKYWNLLIFDTINQKKICWKWCVWQQWHFGSEITVILNFSSIHMCVNNSTYIIRARKGLNICWVC